MRITNDHNTNTIVASATEASEFKDRLGRVIGARYTITEQVWVEATADTNYGFMQIPSARSPAMTGPGTYYRATTQSIRGSQNYQASTSVMCASQEAAQRYCDAFMTRKMKEAGK